MEEHYRSVYRYVRRRSRTATDAEDVTQEVFADAARALDPLLPDSPRLVAWLYTVARRRLIDAARRSARRAEVGGDAVLELVAAPPPDYGWELTGLLRNGIEQLPREQRQVVAMKLLQGLSFAEIAAATHSTDGACRMRFLRGLERLREFLEEEGVTP